MRKKAQAVLLNMLPDIASPKLNDRVRAANTLNNDTIVDLLRDAGCPEDILVSLESAMELSFMQRQVVCRDLAERIKKIPG